MQINVALIGYGYWGPNVARNLSSLSQYSLKYIDLNEDSRSKASKVILGLKFYQDWMICSTTKVLIL